MKKYIILFILNILLHSLYAQHIQNTKADYIWWMGYWDIQFAPNGWQFDFNQKPMKYSLINKLLKGDIMTANICDKNGNLAFHTNGCKIANAQNQIIQGGDTINAGAGYTYFCTSGDSYSPTQGTIIIPSMTDDTSYYMFHERKEYGIDIRVGGFGVDRLQMSKIIGKDGNFRIAFKDSMLLDYHKDSLFLSGQLTACRHANGRDWWIIVPKLFEKAYHVLLFTPNGIKKKVVQVEGFRVYAENGGGMSVFSPDGRKYVEYGGLSDAKIYDFDRCTGQLSNYKHIEINDYADIYLTTGCAISPNSRFLYLTSVGDIYQYDLWADTLENSKFVYKLDTTFADYDNGIRLRSSFWTCQLGADGKIYIASLGGRKYMHVIEKPDLKGAACELKQNGITLPTYITWAIPFFPNYRLGALKGSSCDTLSTPIQEINLIKHLKIFPNPATDIIKIDMTLDDYGKLGAYQLRIVDIVGKVHQTHPLSNFASIKDISIASCPNGLYFVQLVDSSGHILTSNKIIVSR